MRPNEINKKLKELSEQRFQKKRSQMKPIKELVNDPESCERIFDFFAAEDGTEKFTHVELYDYEQHNVYDPNDRCGAYQVELNGYAGTLYQKVMIIITETGILGFRNKHSDEWESVDAEYSPFEFVKLMNELGYGPIENDEKK